MLPWLEDKANRFAGYLFHTYQAWLERFRKQFFPEEPYQVKAALPSLKTSWKFFAPYVFIGIAAHWWPSSKPVTGEVWVAVFSLEGVIAALFVAVIPLVLTAGVNRFRVLFWANIDADLAQRQIDTIKQENSYSWLTASPLSILKAMAVALISLVMLPLVLVTPVPARVTLLAWSIVWTIQSTLSEASVLLAAETSWLGASTYWYGRELHKSLSYCPLCGGTPKDPDWPSPLAELNAAYARERQQTEPQ